MKVLSNGNSKAGIVSMPNGGQVQKIQIVGAKLEWKNAQKKEAKNITSDTIKRIKARNRAFWTNKVCCVRLSAIISENQRVNGNNKKRRLTNVKTPREPTNGLLKECK